MDVENGGYAVLRGFMRRMSMGDRLARPRGSDALWGRCVVHTVQLTEVREGGFAGPCKEISCQGPNEVVHGKNSETPMENVISELEGSISED